MSRILRTLPALAACALGCETPPVAPGLDQYACDGGVCAAPGVIRGSVVYSGTARGDAILLLFDTSALPPPDGNGTGAAAVARVSETTLFHGASGVGPFSAVFTFTQVPSGRSYQIRAFIDATHEFDPFFDYAQQPRGGDPVGGYGDLGGPGGRPRLLAIGIDPGQVVSGINVALTQTLAYDPPSFELAGGSQTLDQSMDRPVRLQLRAVRLAAKGASFANAKFAVELDRDGQGNRRSSLGDGLDDVFPRVFLRQQSGVDGQGNPTALSGPGAIVPCRVIATAVLPELVNLAPGAPPLAREVLDVLVEPFAVGASDLAPLPRIPAGRYQVVVVERSGQVWTLPNALGDAANAGTAYSAASQAESVTFAAQGALPSNSVSGTVAWRGDPSLRSGNIVVQAYRDDPFNPPPPVGAAQPVRVQILPASAAVADSQGFTAAYRMDGLPQGTYVVQALDDVDGNFSPLNLLQTPTAGDLVGAALDGQGRPVSVAVVSGNVTANVTLATRLPADPPAFEIDPATPAQMPADQVTPVRFSVRARPLGFPAGKASAPHFAVQLVRDSGGAAVDADHDGLADVWPRVFLVRLDPSDPAGLTQFVAPDLHTTRTQVIPAAVDPTPFLPALQPQPGGNAAAVVTDKLSIVVRPALLDASTPGAPPQRIPLQPGSYRIVLLSQSGQAWQIPNEAGSAALDPASVCAPSAPTCAPGTVQTQSQSGAFQVSPPAHPVYDGAISGSLTVAGTTPAAAYVFAYAANALPPFGSPLAADVHLGAEFVGGKVNYRLANLPTGDYVVMAVADLRGDFAASPVLLAIAPGAGSLVAAPVSVHVGTAGVPADLAAATALPQRPSFHLADGTGNALTADVVIAFGGAPSASIRIKPAAILGAGVAALRPDAGGAFVLGCDGSGKPVGSSLSLELIKVADAAGLAPEIDGSGRATVIPAALDPSQFSAGTCTPGTPFVVTTTLSVLVSNGSAKVNLLDPNAPPTPIALVAGRYAVAVTSLAKQVWRIPNELQPPLLDPAALLATPAATKSLLQTQQVAVNVSP